MKLRPGIVFAAVFAISSPAFAKNAGFDRPEWTRKFAAEVSETAPHQKVIIKCFGFATFAVVEVNDPGIMGAAILVRPRKKDGATESQLCARESDAKAVALEDADGYVVGAAGGFLFVRSPDSFGDISGLQVFDTASGKKVYEAEGDMDGLSVGRRADTISIVYPHRLVVDCPLARDGAACWKKVLEKNAIPETVRIKAPDCGPPFRRAKSPLENNAQVTVKARIDDLARPSLTFLDGTASCNPSP